MSKINYLKLFSLFFITWFIFAISFSQVIPYMTQIGLSEQQRSFVFVSSAGVGMLAQLVVGYLSDKFQKMKLFFIGSTILLLVFSSLSYSKLPSQPRLSIFLISTFVALFRVTGNLAETWVYQMDEAVSNQFGLVRTFGSIGWAAGAMMIAPNLQGEGFFQLPYWLIPLTLLVVFLSLSLPDSKTIENKESLKLSEVKELFKHQQFRLAIFIFFILFFVLTFEGITVIDKMVEVKATPEHIGRFWGIQALVELPFMILGMRIIKSSGVKKIMLITSFFFIIKYVLFGLATQGDHFVYIALLQIITYPFLILSQKVIVNKTTPEHLRTSGHMVMTGITSNIPIIIVPILSSFLHQSLSYSVILILAGALCSLALIGSFYIEKA